MKPPLFRYRRRGPREAVVGLASDPDAIVLAGGRAFFHSMNFGLANPSLLVDVRRVAEAERNSDRRRADHRQGDDRHRELSSMSGSHSPIPLLNEAMAHVAHIPIRNRGPIVGGLCHADGAAEVRWFWYCSAAACWSKARRAAAKLRRRILPFPP